MADEPQEEKVEETKEQVEDSSPDVIASEAKQSSPEENPVKIAAEPEAPRNDKPSKPVSASLEKIIEQIEKLSVLELADLVHALEDRFGVTAQAAMVAGPAAASAGSSGEPMEEKTTFNVVLSAAGANKIAVIKAVRELVPTLGLKEAKDLVEAAPKPVLESVNKQTAEEAKTKLTAAGGSVELQ